MKNLFYTESDNMLFWIAGYTMDDTVNVVKKTTSLLKNAEIFAKVAKCTIEEVNTVLNPNPPRYQYMRVFYVQTKHIPKEAYVVKKVTEPKNGYSVEQLEWNMWKWLGYN